MPPKTWKTAHLFIGRGLIQAQDVPDETEFLEVCSKSVTSILSGALQSCARRSRRRRRGRQSAALPSTAWRNGRHFAQGTPLAQAITKFAYTQFLEVGLLPFRQVFELVCENEIRDSMTVIAVLHAARLRGWR